MIIDSEQTADAPDNSLSGEGTLSNYYSKIISHNHTITIITIMSRIDHHFIAECNCGLACNSKNTTVHNKFIGKIHPL